MHDIVIMGWVCGPCVVIYQTYLDAFQIPLTLPLSYHYLLCFSFLFLILAELVAYRVLFTIPSKSKEIAGEESSRKDGW